MATMTLSTPLFYKNGKSGVSGIVGYEGSGNGNRVARYSFTSSGEGASHVDVVLRGMSYGGGNTGNIPLSFYIGTDAGSHANAGEGSVATGSLSCRENADYTYVYTGAADVVLLPNTTYYLWVFPSTTVYGWWYWKTGAGYASLATSGGAYSTVSGQNGTLGSANTLRIKRYSAQMTHTVTATCGTASITVGTGIQADSLTWTPPLSWAAQNVNSASVVVTVTCKTYQGSTAIGQSTVSLTFQIPESVVPTASLTVSDAKGYLSQYGAYIQNSSQAKVEAMGSGVYGSAIARYSIQCGSVSADKQTATFGLTASGKVKITVRVTDSRGRSAVASTEINVTAYAAPSAGISALYRCDAAGNEEFLGAYATAVFSARVTSLGGKNSAQYALLYRVRGTTSWTRLELTDLTGSYAPEQVPQIFPADIDSGYEVCIAVTDNFATISCPYRTVQVAKALMDFDRAKWAIAFGQRAVEANAAAFGMPVRFHFGADLAGSRITGMGMPVSGQDGASKEYVDSIVSTGAASGAGAHNSVYRGKNLGSSVTAAQWAAIKAGTFDDMYIGDYWKIGGVTYRIAAFDYYLRSGDTDMTTHHVTLVPDASMYNYVMNDTNITAGGYVGSKMYKQGLNQAKTTITSAFGAAHILTHRQYLCNAVTNGRPSGGSWYNSTVELMTEQNCYGCRIFGVGNDGSNVPALYTVDRSQFPLFAFRPDMISNRNTFWLRDVASAAYFAYAAFDGNATAYNASVAQGVRPAFSIKA